jgi:carbonic anhydrase
VGSSAAGREYAGKGKTMDRRAFLLGAMACPACAAAARASDVHWNFEEADHWGTLDPSFKACGAGREQSPIDLANAIPARLDRLAVSWQPGAFQVVNNGHTIQLNVPAGSTLGIGARRYDLKQFHFHTPSEHAFDGKRTAMEAHFVHAASDGRLAVVGVLMAAGKGHAGFAAVMKAAPKSEGEGHLASPLDPALFLPRGDQQVLYRYEGSLTTPPCTEVVDWNLYGKTLEVAPSDIAAFKAIFPMNARPLQPVNRRFLLKSL